MSDEHKAALAEGRTQGRAVRNYLDALEATKPKRGRKRTPDSVKKRLAGRIVTMYHGAGPAERAQKDFETQFSRREIPDDLPVWTADSADAMGIKDLLVRAGLARSGSEAWRAVDQGAVSIDQVRVSDRNHRQELGRPFVLRLGRRMIRVRPQGAKS